MTKKSACRAMDALLVSPAPTLSTLVMEAAQMGDVDEILARLTPAQLGAIAQAALLNELRDAVGQKIQSARIDIDAERDAWLACYTSSATKRAYARGFSVLATWCQFTGHEITSLSPADADAFLMAERAKGGDNDSIRAVAFACSSFYKFAERRHSFIKNPIRGSMAMPKRSTTIAVIPSPEELAVIHTSATNDPVLAAAITVMNEVGLRIGALPGLTIRPNGSFTTASKGKAVLSFISLSPETTKVLNRLGNGRKPFAQVTVGALRLRFARLVSRLYLHGQVAARYSVHDLRHGFAERNKSRGLYWLANALGHSSVSVTQAYLKNTLGIEPRTIEGGKPQG